VREKRGGRVVASMIAGSVAMLLIGVLNLLAEASRGAHDFLEFIPSMGPLSGKVILGYAIGAALYFVLQPLLRQRDPSIILWTWITLASLVIASLFVFTPFVRWVVG